MFGLSLGHAQEPKDQTDAVLKLIDEHTFSSFTFAGVSFKITEFILSAKLVRSIHSSGKQKRLTPQAMLPHYHVP
jgi:hypothetical protein